MKPEQRQTLWGRLLQDVQTTMDLKSHEYDGDFDVHKQFKDAARELNVAVLQVAGIHLNKHISAINSMVAGRAQGTQTMHERVVDAINFLRILDEMIWEWDNEKEGLSARHGKAASV